MPNSIAGNALRGHLETLVLSVLEQGETHGFDVLRKLDQARRGALEMREGSLYPALYRMEEAGLIKARTDDQPAGRGARRRYYRLTTKGKRQLQRGRQDWEHFVAVLTPIIGTTA